MIWRATGREGTGPDTGSAPCHRGVSHMHGQDRTPALSLVLPLPPGPSLGCLTQPQVCRELAWKKPSSTYPDGKFTLREEQPGALSVRLLHRRRGEVQCQGRRGVFCGTLKQETVMSLQHPHHLHSPDPSSSEPPRAASWSLPKAPGLAHKEDHEFSGCRASG